jgi:hypothetical protein
MFRSRRGETQAKFRFRTLRCEPLVCILSCAQLGNGKVIPVRAWTVPLGSRRLRLPDFKINDILKAVRLSAVHTCRLYPPENISGTHVLFIFVLFYVLFVLCRSVYCLCVNVYCTAATAWLPNCS